MKYIIDIPDDLITIISQQGFTIPSWFQTCFVMPMLQYYENALVQIEISDAKKVIDTNVANLQSQSSIAPYIEPIVESIVEPVVQPVIDPSTVADDSTIDPTDQSV